MVIASAHGEVRRKVQRRSRGIGARFFRDVQALGGSCSDICLGISVACRCISGMAVLPKARDSRRPAKGKGPGGVYHARIAARTVAFNRATVYVAASASCNIEGIDCQSVVGRARTRAVEVVHRAAVEVDRSVSDTHHACNGALSSLLNLCKLSGLFDRRIFIIGLPNAAVGIGTKPAVLERRSQPRSDVRIHATTGIAHN